MLLYAFQGRYGGDKVCRSEQTDFDVGDLLVGSNDMYLVLNNSEFITHNSKLNKEKKNKIHEELTLAHKQFLRKETIELIHRMVQEYYTSYKNVVKLFVTGELADLFKKELTIQKKPFFTAILIHSTLHSEEGVHSSQQLTASSESPNNLPSIIQHLENGQQLIVFPDVRTMINTLQTQGISEKTGIAMLNSTSTQQQKDKAWRGIKMGHINTLICTYSQIFQDRKNLKRIVLCDSHQWYYKNQQDPRYDTREVVKHMAHTHNAALEMSGVHVFHS